MKGFASPLLVGVIGASGDVYAIALGTTRDGIMDRKNWLFSGNPEGAKAGATLYSLIETAKANGLEPYWYLRRLFERLPLASTEEEYRALLPLYIDKTLVIPA